VAELNEQGVNNWEIGFVREGKRRAILERAELLEV
jgi:hypothetical protein